MIVLSGELNLYRVKCSSCDNYFFVDASDEKDAITKANAQHARKASNDTGFHCESGPSMTDVFNLSDSGSSCSYRY